MDNLLFYSYTKHFCYLNGLLASFTIYIIQNVGQKRTQKASFMQQQVLQKEKVFSEEIDYFYTNDGWKVSLPLEFTLSFNVFLPLSFYAKLQTPSLESMQSHIQQLEILSEGTMKLNRWLFTSSYFIHLGWNHCMQAGTLSIYQLAITKIGPVMGLSLNIKEDFS